MARRVLRAGDAPEIRTQARAGRALENQPGLERAGGGGPADGMDRGTAASKAPAVSASPPLTVATFRLNAGQLIDTRDRAARMLRIGLARDGQQLPCFPALLPPPPVGLAGEAAIADWGGTNMRGYRVELAGGRVKVLGGPFADSFREVKDTITARQAFERQAQLLAQAASATGRSLPVGFIWSFPSEPVWTEHGLDGRLVRWTKEIDWPEVVGANVGELLRRAAAARGVSITDVAVLNDTVGALLAGASQARSHPWRWVGSVFGTGHNTAGFFSPENAPKLEALRAQEPFMAVNTEFGSFRPPYWTEWDAQVDRASAQPGQQLLEKMAAGSYLPYVLKARLPGADIDPAIGAAEVVRLRESGNGEERAAAADLLNRSADLFAAELAGVAQVYGDGPPIHVLVEGSFFWKTPGLRERVQETLDHLAGPGKVIIAPALADAGAIGAATAALTVAQGRGARG